MSISPAGKPVGLRREIGYPIGVETIDVVVIGAGIIGLATARALALAGRGVVIVDSEKNIASVTSARNSGVIHAGIYYRPGSKKAGSCVRGRSLLYRYAEERNIPFRNCGKLIVATSESEIPGLHEIKARAERNGVDDLRLLTRSDALGMEPELSCAAALYSPSTGIIDVHALAYELLGDAENAGAILSLQSPVLGGAVTANGIRLDMTGPEPFSVLARNVINAAGLGAQDIAGKIKGVPAPCIPPRYLAKGNYFSVSGKAPFSHLVYPVPVPGGLGAHFTINMAGESLFGPDVEWIDNRDEPSLDYHVDAGRAGAIAASVKRYWPGVEKRTLNPAYSGIRPKLAGMNAPDGDFVIQDRSVHGVKGLINLYGIESPGLTASLAIAGDIAACLLS